MDKKNKIQFVKFPVFVNLKFSSDIWSHFYGVFGIIGFIYTAFTIQKGLKSIQPATDLIPVIKTLSVSVLGLLTTFILAYAYYSRSLKKLSDLPFKNEFLNSQIDSLNITLKHQAETIHNVTHYYRNAYAMINQNLQNKDRLKETDIIEILERFDHSFLINLVTGLQNYFSISSGSSCAITIKLVNKEKRLVKTFFRDPNSLKRRRVADSKYSNQYGIYKIDENTAFNIIVSPNYPNLYFADDDLSEQYKNHQYENSNPEWHKYYNSTLVVPISMVLANNKRNILGFITVDNQASNLSTRINTEFLCGIGDLLYNLFDIYSELITFADSKNIKHDKIERFKVWDYS